MSNYHKRFSKEFKEEAVRLLLTGNKTTAGLGRELGVSATSLMNWQREALGNAAQPAGVKPEGLRINPALLEEENRRLKAENATLLQEREILKKSLGILSRDPLQKGMP
jgi:transposase